MQEFNCNVSLKNGVHARPAGKIASFVKTLNAEVFLEKNDKTANAKDLLPIMLLGIKRGDNINVKILGKNEQDETNDKSKLEEFLNQVLAEAEDGNVVNTKGECTC